MSTKLPTPQPEHGELGCLAPRLHCTHTTRETARTADIGAVRCGICHVREGSPHPRRPLLTQQKLRASQPRVTELLFRAESFITKLPAVPGNGTQCFHTFSPMWVKKKKRHFQLRGGGEVHFCVL